MVQHTPWAVVGGPGRFSCVGADVSSARGPPFGRFKGKGSLGKGGRFPLSGGNVERSETKGVGIIGPYGGSCFVAPDDSAGAAAARPKIPNSFVVESSLIPQLRLSPPNPRLLPLGFGGVPINS